MKFEIGDVVRIRQWDDMVEDFGFDIDGDIDCKIAVFANDMSELCGEVATITGINEDEEIELEFVNESELCDTDWIFTEDMLELTEG